MAFFSASVSLSRYRIMDDVNDQLLREAPERLVKHAFQDIDHTADERSFGWVCADDYLDSKWKASPPEKGHFLIFSLRLDTRRVQPAVFKKHVAIAERSYLESIEDPDKRFMPKDRKREIRDQVMLKLRARALPVPAVFEAAWDLRTHTVYLASTNSKVRSLFEDLFTLTFELALEPLTPFFLASRMLGEEALPRLESLEPTDFPG
ncbi:recombination-associated protein RdgC [Desulfocurvibacter africanus]|uniref:Uncharacterized protein n=1 Tax=Desulfocurvibacter africanus subsp. africanus str. Walvis Bay TaxID=690850 RepID=F3Z1W0_DESAF|nr:recombination-associated protein RdgC [Desulfocurvibacter africanus]EGJ50068.1 hypothetical protein Desaf_1732 [Desulfocurvibacter africanus subsp. africanus str. Walvis Bay]